MSGELVRGGSGTIQIHELPNLKGQGFLSYARQVFEADLYEEEHPEVTVVRPWESKDQLEARLTKRKQPPVSPPSLVMDPARAEPELRRRRYELATLQLDHPQYEKLFNSLVAKIHDLEDCLGWQRTRFKKGEQPRWEETPVPKELLEKLAKYKIQREPTRRKSIEGTDDLDFLALIRDHEELAALKMMAVQRIEVLRSLEAVQP